MELARADERPEVRMTSADKDKINLFSRLLVQKANLSSRLATRATLRQLHDDAAEELLLLDDDKAAEVQFNVGDAFFFEDKDAVEEAVERVRDDLTHDIDALNAEAGEVRIEIARLKKVLYAKFGSTINLEEGE
jgi:prefoldin subunit 4